MPNRLSKEKSPYLLQHAKNPVDWYPWGEEAFQKARRENKPIFLSIGYSTCHWCHVMERESFEDREVAALLKGFYVAVKVDKEERPDIDAVYMSVCQAMTGGGGWPLTLLLTPEQKPFYAATYLPKEDTPQMPGLMTLLREVASLWKTAPEKLIGAGETITDYFRQKKEGGTGKKAPSKRMCREAAEQLKKSFDNRWGGFLPAPKFPSPHILLFLLRYAALEQDFSALHMAEATLEGMYRGGLFDHVGGGFSRYSTDKSFLVPHFEKMLYDNALLCYVYTEAYEQLQRPIYKTAALRTISYVLTTLRDEKGGFYCGQDADSGGVEGKYYIFTPDEIKKELGETEGNLFCQWFGITENGNFEGKNIPNLLCNPIFEKQNPGIAALCQKLAVYREKREKLHRDEKILLSWNALMIAALAKAAHVFEEASFLAAAEKAYTFLNQYLIDDSGRLFLRYKDGETLYYGQLDDYAFYAFALLALYDASYNIKYLQETVRVASSMVNYFYDEDNGGFYFYAEDAEQLIYRPKESYDGAVPSGNTVAAYVLGRLYRLTGELCWKDLWSRQLGFLADSMSSYPSAYCFGLYAMMEALYPMRELVCASAEENPPRGLKRYCDSLTAVLCKTIANQEELGAVAPFTKEIPIPETGAAYYECKNGACMAPVYEKKSQVLSI